MLVCYSSSRFLPEMYDLFSSNLLFFKEILNLIFFKFSNLEMCTTSQLKHKMSSENFYLSCVHDVIIMKWHIRNSYADRNSMFGKALEQEKTAFCDFAGNGDINTTTKKRRKICFFLHSYNLDEFLMSWQSYLWNGY